MNRPIGTTAEKKTRLVLSCALVLATLAVSPQVLAGDVYNGKSVYKSHCSGCHGVSGRGEVGNAPDFSRGEGLRQSDVALFEKISRGGGAMPGYRGMLTDQEILDVISYMRVFL